MINTKKLRVLRDRKEIAAFLDQLLSMDCLAERWYPKASFQSYSYDLRAVWQFGQLDFCWPACQRASHQSAPE